MAYSYKHLCFNPYIFIPHTSRSQNITKILLVLPLLLYRALVDGNAQQAFSFIILLSTTLVIELILALVKKTYAHFDFNSVFNALVLSFLLPSDPQFSSSIPLVVFMALSLLMGRTIWGSLSYSFINPIVLFLVFYSVNDPLQASLYNLPLNPLLVAMLCVSFVLFITLKLGAIFTPLLTILLTVVFNTVLNCSWPLTTNTFVTSLLPLLTTSNLVLILVILTNPLYMPLMFKYRFYFALLVAFFTVLFLNLWNHQFALPFALLVSCFTLPSFNRKETEHFDKKCTPLRPLDE